MSPATESSRCYCVQDLLGDLSPQVFLAQNWGQKPHFVPGARDKFTELFQPEAFAPLAHSLLDANERLGRVMASFYHGDSLREQRLSTAVEFELARRAGCSLVAQCFEAPNQALRSLIVSVKTGLQWAAGTTTTLFHSPPSSGYGLHYDAASVFVLQLAGTKRWRVGRGPALAAPLARHLMQASVDDPVAQPAWLTEAVVQPSPEELDELVLRPGDVLYVPPGTWHEVSAVESSLHVSLSFTPVSSLQMFSDLLAQSFVHAARWRQDLPPSIEPPAPGELPAAVEAFFAERIAELRCWAAALSPRELQRAWLGHVHCFAFPAMETAALAAEIEPDDVLIVPELPPLRCAKTFADDGAECIVLYAGARSIVLDARLWPLVRELCTVRRIAVADACRRLRGAASPVHARRGLAILTAHGFLAREERAPRADLPRADSDTERR